MVMRVLFLFLKGCDSEPDLKEVDLTHLHLMNENGMMTCYDILRLKAMNRQEIKSELGSRT
jgi:hypothetical protein